MSLHFRTSRRRRSMLRLREAAESQRSGVEEDYGVVCMTRGTDIQRFPFRSASWTIAIRFGAQVLKGLPGQKQRSKA